MQTGTHDGIQVLSFQESAADSSGPKIHIFFGAIGHLLVDNDVSQIQNSAGLEHTKYFLSNVKCIVVEGDSLSCSFPEFRVDSPKFSIAGTGMGQHGLAEIHSVHSAVWPRLACGDQRIGTVTTAQV